MLYDLGVMAMLHRALELEESHNRMFVDWVLWHINPCTLVNAKSICEYISNI